MKNGTKIVQKLNMAGNPGEIILKSSHSKISALGNSLAIITADIVDSLGNHIFGAKNTIRWEVSGPATLVGPSVYETDFYKNGDTTGVLYIDMPVSNVIRSTGEVGNIVVKAFSEGLRTGEIKIFAEENPVVTDGISEPELNLSNRIQENIKITDN
jgi:hypothetical protein